jgi:hypothetical protein
VSRANVRAAVAQWFDPGAVPGLFAIHRAEPKIIPGSDYGLEAFGTNVGNGSGAYAVVHIADERETRIAIGGAHSGMKHITYDVALVIHFRSVKPDAIEAMDDYDTLIEAVKQRLRADRNLGQPTSVWQAGSDPGDIHIQSDLPAQDDGSVYIWSVMEFKVIEEIFA